MKKLRDMLMAAESDHLKERIASKYFASLFQRTLVLSGVVVVLGCSVMIGQCNEGERLRIAGELSECRQSLRAVRDFCGPRDKP